MRATINHTPPNATAMQSTPMDNTSELVMAQVDFWAASGVPMPIHTQSALEIASWWATPGNAFAVFASTGTITEDLDGDIAEALHDEQAMLYGSAQSGHILALQALKAYVYACTVPVYTVGRNTPGYEPTPYLTYQDALNDFIDTIKDAPSELTADVDAGNGDCSGEGDGLGCSANGDEACAYHSLKAEVYAYLVDSVQGAYGAGSVANATPDLRIALCPDYMALGTHYWLSVTDITYGEYCNWNNSIA